VPSNETPPNVFEMLHSIFVYFSTSSHPSLDPLRPSFEKELLRYILGGEDFAQIYLLIIIFSNEIKGASFMEVIEKIKSWSARLLTKVEMLTPKYV
jgi:hypothetical protein